MTVADRAHRPYDLAAPGRFDAPPAVGRLQRWGLVAGGLGLAVTLVGFFLDPEQFFRSWLVAVTFGIAIPLGFLGLLMIHHMTGGTWGTPVRRIFEAAASTLPLFLLLFLPIALLGMGELYVWTDESVVAGDYLLEKKVPYLNVPGFQLRALVYFAIWIGLAFVLGRLSVRQDEAPSPALVKRMQAISAPGLVLLALSVSFASFDWLMSLEPTWYSTMYGVWFIGAMGAGALTFLILVAGFLERSEPMRGVLATRHFHDWGKLLFAFVMLWAYFVVSQFLIIWSANLPDEIAWYRHRMTGGWMAVTVLLFLARFGLPFLLLLSRDLKENRRTLALVAAFLLLAQWLDFVWQVEPSFHPGDLYIHWMDVAAPVAVGGLFLAAFAWQLGKRPVVPVNDPYLEEAIGHGHGH